MGSASGLRDGNQAKKAQLFTVSVFGSHAGPGSAKSDSFFVFFFGSPAHIQLFRCCGRYRYCGSRDGWCFCEAPPPAVTPHAVSGWGHFRLAVARLRFTRWMVLLLGRPTRCDSTCSQREGAFSSGSCEIEDHEMDGAFDGRPPRCDPTCGQRVGATLDETELQDAQVHAFGGENVGVFHVHNLLGNVNRSRRASGSRVIPPSRGGSGAVLPTQRRLRGRGTTLLRSGDAAPGRGAPGRTRPEAGSDSFCLVL